MIGVYQQLKPLQHTVVRQGILGLFQVTGEFVRLDTPKDRDAQIGDEDGATADAVCIKTLCSVPGFQIKSTLTFMPFPVPRCNQPNQLIA